MGPNRTNNTYQNERDDDELSYDDDSSVASGGIDDSSVASGISMEQTRSPTEGEEHERATLTSTATHNLSQGCGRFFDHWRILLAGQGLSLLLAFSGAMSASMHFDCNVSAPTMQTALVFSLMSLHFCTLKSRKRSTHSDGRTRENNDETSEEEPKVASNYSMLCKQICIPWWAYFLLALVTAEATFLTFLAYKYTSLPSASLLDNTNIVAAMLGSRIILKRRYRATHIIGAMICCAGVVFNVFSDFEEDENDPNLIDDAVEKTIAEVYPKKVLGDTFAILGGLMVGLCDVLIESIVKEHVSLNEYLGTVGIFGAIIGFIQAGIVEKDQIAKLFAADESTLMSSEELYDMYDDPYDGPRICSRENAVGLLSAYMLAQYLFNYSMTRFLKESESALLTLSLLTADLYAVIFTIVAEKIPPPGLFYAAFILVVVGVLVYEISPSPLGYADDLQMQRGISYVDRRSQYRNQQDCFQMSDLSLSSKVSGAGDGGDKSVASHEVV